MHRYTLTIALVRAAGGCASGSSVKGVILARDPAILFQPMAAHLKRETLLMEEKPSGRLVKVLYEWADPVDQMPSELLSAPGIWSLRVRRDHECDGVLANSAKLRSEAVGRDESSVSGLIYLDGSSSVLPTGERLSCYRLVRGGWSKVQ